MPRRSPAGSILRSARGAARLTQRHLARRAGTTQSVVARIENGDASPGWDTLARLIRAAGFELEVALRPRPTSRSHMMQDVGRILALSPEDRLREVAAVSRFLANARRV